MGPEKGLTETLWVKLQGERGERDLVVGVYYRPPHQEEELDLKFSRQLGEAVRAKDVVVMGV